MQSSDSESKSSESNCKTQSILIHGLSCRDSSSSSSNSFKLQYLMCHDYTWNTNYFVTKSFESSPAHSNQVLLIWNRSKSVESVALYWWCVDIFLMWRCKTYIYTQYIHISCVLKKCATLSNWYIKRKAFRAKTKKRCTQSTWMMIAPFTCRQHSLNDLCHFSECKISTFDRFLSGNMLRVKLSCACMCVRCVCQTFDFCVFGCADAANLCVCVVHQSLSNDRGYHRKPFDESYRYRARTRQMVSLAIAEEKMSIFFRFRSNWFAKKWP